MANQETTMNSPEVSDHFKRRTPSGIRIAQLEFLKRKGNTKAINLAIGNVSLPMHPSMIKRMKNLGEESSPFKDGVVQYSLTAGTKEVNEAFMNIIASGGYSTKSLYSQVTDGGSLAMELICLGTCAYNKPRPLLMIEPAYTNYLSMAERTKVPIVSVKRTLQDDGKFSMPSVSEIEKVIETTHPGAMVVIPYDNPSGQFIDHKAMVLLGNLCAKYNLWMVSDEAYRELNYGSDEKSSIWGLDDKEVPGIEGRRISIETASKVWNACGLRIGALITDSKDFHDKAVAEYTANLCSSTIGQYIFGSLAHESHEELRKWYGKQRTYYYSMLSDFTKGMKENLPGVIVSSPEAAIYSVIDVRNIASPGFDAMDFVMYCTREGKVNLDGEEYTLLVAPMAGFYSTTKGEANPGKTQMRVSYVEKPEVMKRVPGIFAQLFRQYEKGRK